MVGAMSENGGTAAEPNGAPCAPRKRLCPTLPPAYKPLPDVFEALWFGRCSDGNREGKRTERSASWQI